MQKTATCRPVHAAANEGSSEKSQSEISSAVCCRVAITFLCVARVQAHECSNSPRTSQINNTQRKQQLLKKSDTVYHFQHQPTIMSAGYPYNYQQEQQQQFYS